MAHAPYRSAQGAARSRSPGARAGRAPSPDARAPSDRARPARARRASPLAVAASLALALLSCLPSARAQSRGDVPWGAVYRGSWDGWPIVLSLQVDGSQASGRLDAPGHGLSLLADGSAGSDGELTLDLRVPPPRIDGADGTADGTPVGRLTGRRSMAPNDDGQRLAGALTVASRGGPFALERVAQVATVRVDEGMIQAEMSYPDVLAGPWRDAGRRLADHWRALLDDFVEQGRSLLGTGEIFHAWQMVGSVDVELWTDRALSLRTSAYRYTGGAHGLESFGSATYALEGGSARLLALSDLFVPGADVLGRLEPLLLADLRVQGAQWVLEGQVTHLKPTDLALFNLVPGGLQFTFPPYAMGPYVQGAFTVVVPPASLADIVPPDGLVRALDERPVGR